MSIEQSVFLNDSRSKLDVVRVSLPRDATYKSIFYLRQGLLS